MQTNSEYAAYVEQGDFLAIGEENYLRVDSIRDDGDSIVFVGKDDNDDSVELTFAPFDTAYIVTSFDEDFTFEDVDIEDESA